jgi:hypothetical protein
MTTTTNPCYPDIVPPPDATKVEEWAKVFSLDESRRFLTLFRVTTE